MLINWVEDALVLQRTEEGPANAQKEHPKMYLIYNTGLQMHLNSWQHLKRLWNTGPTCGTNNLDHSIEYYTPLKGASLHFIFLFPIYKPFN